MKALFAMSLLLVVLSTGVLAAEVEDIQATIGKITTLVSAIGGGLAVLAATIVGVMMFQAKDPSDRDQLKEKLKYIIIGMVVIVIAPKVVSYVLGTGA